MRTLRLLFPFLVGWAMGCAPQAESGLGQLEQTIVEGVPDTNPAHMAVVAIDLGWSMCSGTLIAPRVVLTAGHCVIPDHPELHEVFFGATTQDAESRKVAHIWRHPDYSRSFISFDIAMLRLASGAPAHIKPIPHLPRALALTNEDAGIPLEFVGFGTDENLDFTTKKTINGKLERVCDTVDDCAGMGYPSKEHTICYDGREGGPCHGDSGGPAFGIRDRVEYVVGITSYGDYRCLDYGCSTKVDSFYDQIQAFVESTANLGDACQEDFECLSAHCAGGVCCDYACASLCETCTAPGAEGRCQRATGDDAPPECASSDGGGCASLPGTGRLPAAFVLLALCASLVRRRRIQ